MARRSNHPKSPVRDIPRPETKNVVVALTPEQYLAVGVIAYRLRTTRSAVVRFAIDALVAIAQGKPVPVTPFITDLQRLIDEYKKEYEESREKEGGNDEGE